MSNLPNANVHPLDNLVITLDSLFNVGDLVLIDQCNRAYITEKNRDHNGHIDFTIRHVVGNTIEHNVSYQRCEVISISHSTNTRSGLIRNSWLTNETTRQLVNSNQESSQTLPHSPTVNTTNDSILISNNTI